jgi:hypothetical protein
MRRSSLVAMLVVGAILVPLGVFASHQFNDVPDSHIFHTGISWMKDHNITVGCNPPANTNYCPDENVTRGEMATFMKRLAENNVVDAATLDGLDSTELVRANTTAGPSVNIGTSGSADVAPTTITVPSTGLLVMTSTLELDLGNGSGDAAATLQFVRDATAVGPIWSHQWLVTRELNTTTVHYTEVVGPGEYEIALRVSWVQGFVNADNPVVTVMWIPFGGDGLTPAGASGLQFSNPDAPSPGDN